MKFDKKEAWKTLIKENNDKLLSIMRAYAKCNSLEEFLVEADILGIDFITKLEFKINYWYHQYYHLQGLINICTVVVGCGIILSSIIIGMVVNSWPISLSLAMIVLSICIMMVILNLLPKIAKTVDRELWSNDIVDYRERN